MITFTDYNGNPVAVCPEHVIHVRYGPQVNGCWLTTIRTIDQSAVIVSEPFSTVVDRIRNHKNEIKEEETK